MITAISTYRGRRSCSFANGKTYSRALANRAAWSFCGSSFWKHIYSKINRK